VALCSLVGFLCLTSLCCTAFLFAPAGYASPSRETKTRPSLVSEPRHMANRLPPSLPHPPSSSPSSSSQSSPGLSNLPPLSSPWACRVEWFDLHGNSLGFAPGPIQDLASSSQLAMVPLAPPPEHFIPFPPPSPPVVEPSILAPLAEPPASLEEPPGQPHSCSDCASCSRILTHGRYYTTWFLSSERMWTTYAFGWRTWTGEGKELNLFSQPWLAPCTLQVWQPVLRQIQW
jgi:hypothetical protein